MSPQFQDTLKNSPLKMLALGKLYSKQGDILERLNK
jgi:hypothetical protein